MQYDSAYFYFSKSLAIGKQLDNKQMISNSLTYLGEYSLKTNKLKDAIEYLKQSLKIAKEIGIVYEIESVVEFLHQAYALNGNFEDSYKTLLLYKQLADSANNLKTMQKITELEEAAKFKKEQEISQLKQERKEIQNKLKLNTQKQIRNIAILIVLALSVMLYILYVNNRKKTRMNLRLRLQHREIIIQKEEIEAQRNNISELNKTKDKFFAIIAHDLRNPISGIYQLSELMNEDFEQLDIEKMKEYISLIHVSTKKTYELLNNLLSWAMIQTGGMKISKLEFSINQIFKDNIELLGENIRSKNIKVELPAKNDCVVHADRKMINTVIRNLIHNAIKFTNAGGKITLNVTQKEKNWHVSVADSGIGIAEKDIPMLFDAGQSSKSIGSSSEKGTGLGLVLCKEFVELNKGTIWAKSEINKGTTFYFTLPV